MVCQSFCRFLCTAVWAAMLILPRSIRDLELARICRHGLAGIYMNDDWFYRIGDLQTGPFSASRLIGMIRMQPIVRLTMLVRRGRQGNWQAAGRASGGASRRRGRPRATAGFAGRRWLVVRRGYDAAPHGTPRRGERQFVCRVGLAYRRRGCFCSWWASRRSWLGSANARGIAIKSAPIPIGAPCQRRRSEKWWRQSRERAPESSRSLQRG